MKFLKGKKGYTLVEALTVLAIMGLISSGALAIMIASAKCYDNTTAESFTDVDAVQAMAMIVTDVREAKSIAITNGDRLQVTFPERTDEGYYDRRESDLDHRVTFYLSDSTGTIGNSGTWLWRSITDGTKKMLKKDVAAISFEQDTSRSVKITVTTENHAASGPKRTELTQRVVYLRNY